MSLIQEVYFDFSSGPKWRGGSRAEAELALEGDLVGAMPSWRRMAMDMRGPSASSVSARAPRGTRSGLCAHTLLPYHKATLRHLERGSMMAPPQMALHKHTRQPMPVSLAQAMQHAPGYLTAILLWEACVVYVRHDIDVKGGTAGCAPRPWPAVRLSGAGLPARAWLPLQGRHHARGWAGSAPVQQGQALSRAASAHREPSHLSHLWEGLGGIAAWC